MTPTELAAAAERRRSIGKLGCRYINKKGFDADKAMNDTSKLTDFAVSLFDPRPLASLSEDEWREMGFYVSGLGHQKNVSLASLGRHSTCIYCEYSHAYQTCFINIGEQLTPVATVGQLHALMFAMGQNQ